MSDHQKEKALDQIRGLLVDLSLEELRTLSTEIKARIQIEQLPDFLKKPPQDNLSTENI